MKRYVIHDTQDDTYYLSTNSTTTHVWTSSLDEANFLSYWDLENLVSFYEFPLTTEILVFKCKEVK